MADIFGSSQPPAWLVEATKQTPGELGSIAGLALGGGLNALEQDPNAKDSRKGFKQGLAEARLNEADPLWKIKLSQSVADHQANLLGRAAQAQSAIALANERKAETAAWMEDAPRLSSWLTASPEQRKDLPTPTAQSKQGLTLLQKTEDNDQRYFIQRDNQKIREDTSKIQQENQKRSLDWANAVGAADPDTQAKIAELPNQGWVQDGQGRKISPSSQALGILNDWRKSNNLLPFGAKQTEVVKPDAIAVEKEKQKGRTQIETQKEQAKVEYEKLRQQDRVALEDVRQKYKIDIEKMKLTDKDSKTGKTVTEEEFVNRHLNTLFNAMYKETSNPKAAMADAEKTLHTLYRSRHPATAPAPVKPPAAVAPAPAPTEQTKPATNAPAASDKDPLGIFK